MKKILLAGFILFIVYTIFKKGDEKEETPQTKYLSSSSSDYKPEPINYNSEISAKMYILDTSMDRAKNRNTKVDILAEVDLFKRTADFIADAPDTLRGSLKTQLGILKSRLEKIQKEDFPILRKKYCDWSSEQVWENNVDIVCSGEANNTITFIGGMFANRGNIKKTQETLIDVLNNLRFKTVNYKWYKYDSDYTYYTINSKSDKDL